MYHIVYSAIDNDYTLMYKANDCLFYKQGFGWHTNIATLLNQPVFDATKEMQKADQSWVRRTVYSSLTYPTIASVISTNPELLI